MGSLTTIADQISVAAIAFGAAFAIADHLWSGRFRFRGMPVVGVVAFVSVYVAAQLGYFGANLTWQAAAMIALQGYATYFALRLVLRTRAPRAKVGEL